MANSKRKGRGRTAKTKTCSTGFWDGRKLPFRLVTGTHGSENINHTGTNIHPLGFQVARQTMDGDTTYRSSILRSPKLFTHDSMINTEMWTTDIMPRGTNPKAVDFIFNSGLAIRTARIGPTPGRTAHTIFMAFHDYFMAPSRRHQGAIMHHPSIQISKRQALRQLTASTTGRPTRSAASFSDFQASSAQLGCCKKWTSKTPYKLGKNKATTLVISYYPWRILTVLLY